MYFDSHVHLKIEEINQWSRILGSGYLGVLANASSIDEFKTLAKLAKKSNSTYISFGIHPWDSMNLIEGQNRSSVERYIKLHICNMEYYYQKSHVIGEIGMDSLWCDADKDIQRLIFLEQLQMAQILSKPVVLHTKGCEAEIAQILKNYSVKKLIHWYSCENYLDEYLRQDCYFTIGPDVVIDEAAKKIARSVPMNRILVETDGTEAVKWAIGKDVTPYDTISVLENSICEISKIKGVMPEYLKKQINANFMEFLQIK